MGSARGSIRENWRRWRALGAIDRRETLRAAALVPLCDASVRAFGVKRTREWLRRAQAAPGLDARAVERAVRAVERVRGHSPLRGTCLSRSLVLEHLLGRAGIACELRIGVRRTGESLAGHAWVELDGRPLNDTPGVGHEFAPLRK